jgi:hypothetical protein
VVGLLFRAKRATKSAEWFQSYRRFRGEGFTRNLAKNNLFSKSSPMAQLTRAVHAEICVSQRKLSWQICYNTCVWHQACNRCVLSSTGCLPAQQEKTLLSVGCGRRTRTPRHICGAICRAICPMSACAYLTAPPYSLIREFSAPNSTRAPAASGVCMQITPELSAGTRAPVQHKAMCNVPPACAACGVLRSAPGASSPQIVGCWPFTAAVRTLRRPRLAGEARPAAPRWV